MGCVFVSFFGAYACTVRSDEAVRDVRVVV